MVHHRPRSFVRRGRMTPSQAAAKAVGQLQFGLSLDQGMIDFDQVFGRNTPCFLEIGFGSGHSLFALAKAHPDKNFIGVETHRSGLGALLKGMIQENITNIRLYEADVRALFESCFPDESLSGIQFFFPDPWPKRRHHARRLIQTEFIRQMIKKLKKGGELHFATDWEEYALQMMEALSGEQALCNLAGANQFSSRSPYRPCITKFERRAIQEGRSVRELQFVKI